MQVEAKRLITTRLLPKTGQLYRYEIGDDGDYEAGWWKGRKVANNKTRFIAKSIGVDKIVIDLATGLMWAANGNEEGCVDGSAIAWTSALGYAEALTFAGYTDWRVPNINELTSLINYGLVTMMIDEPPFRNTQVGKYWSSTTKAQYTEAAHYVMYINGYIYYEAKTANNYLRCVRGGV